MSGTSRERLDASSSGGSATLGGSNTTISGGRKLSFCMRWRWWIRPIVITVYVLFVLIAVPWLVYNSIKDGFSRDDQLILIAGLFVLSAIPLSVWHIIQHMMHFTKPVLQKHIVRILWMVPIYALNAWLGLIFYEQSFYMDCFREIYEAYVIYNFMFYLLNYLNLEMDLERSLELKPQQRHVFPLCCMQPWPMGRDLVHNCKHGILQYAVLRLFTTLIAIICEAFDVYGESTFRTDVAYPYLVTINNLSQFTAMYCLVLFYKANRAELAPMKPLPKFLCIKAVIFFSFFQSVIITGLVYYGYVRNIFGADDADADSDAGRRNLSSKLQDFLICIEMFVAAVAHKYSFPHRPFHINIPNYSVAAHGSWLESCLAMCNVSDVYADVSDHFGVVGSSMVRRLRGRSDYQLTRGASTSADSPSARESERLLAPPHSSGGGGGGGSSSGTRHYQHSPHSAAAAGASSSPHSRYGSVAPAAASATASTTGGAGGGHINIVKLPAAGSAARKEYSPQFGGGAPRVGGQFFGVGSCSSGSQMTGGASSSASLLLPAAGGGERRGGGRPQTTSSEANTSSSQGGGGGGRADHFSGLTTGAETRVGFGGGGRPKSTDSAASDWLSTPTDEMSGIDVSGPGDGDLIRLRPDPRV